MLSGTIPIADARHLELIEAMTECAFALGKTAAEIAERAACDDTAGFLAASAEARHCFFAVRMGIRLSMAQRAAVRAVPAAAVERPEREELERERPEVDPPERVDPLDDERLDVEREREGDYEPVSLPQFLKRLGVVAANAERRQGDLPPDIRDTTLPTLKTLLGQMAPPPDPVSGPVAVLARPSAPTAARSRLLGSAGALRLPPPRRRSG